MAAQDFIQLCILTISVLAIVGVHTFEAWSWSVAYFTLCEFTDLNQSLHFSVVTSATLGYGDITFSDRWQLLGTVETVGGLIKFGVTTSFHLEILRPLFSEVLVSR